MCSHWWSSVGVVCFKYNDSFLVDRMPKLKDAFSNLVSGKNKYESQNSESMSRNVFLLSALEILFSSCHVSHVLNLEVNKAFLISSFHSWQVKGLLKDHKNNNTSLFSFFFLSFSFSQRCMVNIGINHFSCHCKSKEILWFFYLTVTSQHMCVCAVCAASHLWWHLRFPPTRHHIERKQTNACRSVNVISAIKHVKAEKENVELVFFILNVKELKHSWKGNIVVYLSIFRIIKKKHLNTVLRFLKIWYHLY